MRCGGFKVMASAWLLGLGCAAAAQPEQPENQPETAPAAQQPENSTVETAKTAGKIATQPARDVGIAKTKIPPVLAEAREAPYSLDGLTTCEEISSAAKKLHDVLGPDFNPNDEKKENRAGRIAAAGGKTVVNALVPFRGLVREITGAAPAQRRLNAAIDAGFARRGFLRGVHQARGCQTEF